MVRFHRTQLRLCSTGPDVAQLAVFLGQALPWSPSATHCGCTLTGSWPWWYSGCSDKVECGCVTVLATMAAVHNVLLWLHQGLLMLFTVCTVAASVVTEAATVQRQRQRQQQ